MTTDTLNPRSWLYPTPRGLYCRPGDFYIDPAVAVSRAVITHGHGDHARPGNEAVLATPETIAIMRARYGEVAGGTLQAAGYGERVALGDVVVTLVPAGHVLGSAQAVIDHRGGDNPRDRRLRHQAPYGSMLGTPVPLAFPATTTPSLPAPRDGRA